MKKIVLTYGFISGIIVSTIMGIAMAVYYGNGSEGMEGSMAFGYASMVLAFLLIYFAQARYKENVGGGAIRYGKAFQVGILVALISSVCYVAMWMVLSHYLMPDFMEQYAAAELAKLKAAGASATKIAATQKEMAFWAEVYKNPFAKAGMTFMEIFPVGLLVTIISSFIVRMKNRKPAAA